MITSHVIFFFASQRHEELRGRSDGRGEERGLLFSGFSSELPGSVILDVLEGELGMTQHAFSFRG